MDRVTDRHATRQLDDPLWGRRLCLELAALIQRHARCELSVLHYMCSQTEERLTVSLSSKSRITLWDRRIKFHLSDGDENTRRPIMSFRVGAKLQAGMPALQVLLPALAENGFHAV